MGIPEICPYLRKFFVHPGCGGVFSGLNGTLHSPPEGTYGECVYTITTPSTQHNVQISFLEFNINTDCDEEFIQVRGGLDSCGVWGF